MKIGDLIKNQYVIFFVLMVVIIAGFFGFWYWRSQNFSQQILKLGISGPTSVKMGDEVVYTVNYKNTSNFVLQNPTVAFQIPDDSLTEDGQTLLSQTLQNISPGGQGLVQFKVRFLGKEGDLESLNASLSYTPQNLSVRYESDAAFTVKIDDVPLTLDFDLPASVQAGKEITYNINYFSNTDYPLENLSVKVDPVNGFTIESAEPVSLDNIEWKLPTLEKAQGGRIAITGTVAADAPATSDFSVHLGMWVDGTFVILKNTSQQVNVADSLVAAQPVNSPDLTVSQQAFYEPEVGIENSGPVPPQVGQTTTYTINWQIKNATDTVNNVKVVAVLPPNLTLVDNFYPDAEADNFTFDTATRQIVWLVGDLAAGAGVNSFPPSIYFQVALTPTAAMQGQVAGLVGKAVISGEDQTLGATITSNAQALDTSLPNDKSVSGGGIVK